MTTNASALLITVLILIAMMLWIPFLGWCFGCIGLRGKGEHSAPFGESEPSILVDEGVEAASEGRRW